MRDCASDGPPSDLGAGTDETTSVAPVEEAGRVWRLQYPIETPRLRLRPHRLDDLDDLVHFHGDPQVTRYIPWPVRDRRATEEALRSKLAQGTVERSGQWLVLAVEEVESATVVGEVLLKRMDDGSAEVGYVLGRRSQGRGLASEAVRALLDVAATRLGVASVSAVVAEPNIPSRRLLERLGFHSHDDSTQIIDGETYISYRVDVTA